MPSVWRSKYIAALAALMFGGLSAISSASAEVPAGCATKFDPPLRDFRQLPNLNLFKRELLYYRCTRYDSLTECRASVPSRSPI
jgi:hypothetical protein